MRSTKCMFSAAAALRRVFITPIERPQLQFLLAHRPALPSPASTRAPSLALAQQRHIVSDAKGVKNRLPRNHEIEARYVSLVDADGKLNDPQPTSHLLSRLDLKTHSLVMLADRDGEVPPIVKVFDKKIMRQAEREAEKKQRRAKNGSKSGKTLELNWNISAGDLGHRMKKLKEFLVKGLKVDVMLARKRKGGQKSHVPEVRECEALIERIRAFVREVEGAKEYKPMEGKVPRIEPKVVYAPGEERPVELVKRGEVKLFFQGKVSKDGKAVEVEEEDDVDEEEEEEEENLTPQKGVKKSFQRV